MGRNTSTKENQHIYKERKDMIAYVDPYDANKHIDVSSEQIIAKGGDGTLLKAIKKFHGLHIPFYPLASGTRNFMMNRTLTTEDITTIPLTLLQIDNDTDAVAFNEVAIGSFCGWIEFSTSTARFPSFRGSGLIISTAQGSTGLNLNNSGPILPLESDQWAITSNQAPIRVKTVVNSEPLHIVAKSREPFEIKLAGVVYKKLTEIEFTITRGPVVQLQYTDIMSFKEKRWNNR